MFILVDTSYMFSLIFLVILGDICFLGFLLKVIYFQNLDFLIFYFFMTYYKFFTN